MYARYIKRPLDLILSLIALILLSPLFLGISIWIKLDSKGPVFFRQKRVGKDKKLFMIYKFRSMRNDTPHDTPTHMMKNPNSYITKCGALLRKTSLDELPQLLNIICGDMSIVGPRPALYNQDDLIAERDKWHANDVRPGLTGWAQINGRDRLSIPKKAKFDGEYAANITFRFDLRCIFGTFSYVLHQRGIVEGTQDDNAKENDQ